ncbi:hypothetical protein E0485_15110 [Paenibacillus albiflavus]|uniref:Uncharacterized protein n=1 Tax=Paenibacillus albiflavus TaxID=2545760 RepID=A0A4R4EDT7_9BACL|nr:hypothetical protein [Paenibacillus albiflavus]TCZ76165.1 hypothetical protein E0485_15110 [Paenibacillus albiflavus]
MKQRIAIEQLDELAEQQKEKVREWWYGSPPRLSDVYVVKVKYDDLTRYEGPHIYSGHRDFLEDYYTGEALPFLSIGQMIDLLESNGCGISMSTYKDEWEVAARKDGISKVAIEKELCDTLWNVLKQIL